MRLDALWSCWGLAGWCHLDYNTTSKHLNVWLTSRLFRNNLFLEDIYCLDLLPVIGLCVFSPFINSLVVCWLSKNVFDFKTKTSSSLSPPLILILYDFMFNFCMFLFEWDNFQRVLSKRHHHWRPSKSGVTNKVPGRPPRTARVAPLRPVRKLAQLVQLHLKFSFIPPCFVIVDNYWEVFYIYTLHKDRSV